MFLLNAVIVAQQIPLANFNGTVHDVTKKEITIQNDDGNLVEFEINHKTTVMRGKKEIQPEQIMPGDQVNIQARQEMLQFLIAVVVTVRTPPKQAR